MTDIVTNSITPSDNAQDASRRRIMRRIALGSFIYMVGQGVAVTAFVLLSPERTVIGTVIQGLSPLIIATNGMFATVVLGFMGSAVTEKIKTGTS